MKCLSILDSSLLCCYFSRSQIRFLLGVGLLFVCLFVSVCVHCTRNILLLCVPQSRNCVSHRKPSPFAIKLHIIIVLAVFSVHISRRNPIVESKCTQCQFWLYKHLPELFWLAKTKRRRRRWRHIHKHKQMHADTNIHMVWCMRKTSCNNNMLRFCMHSHAHDDKKWNVCLSVA